MEEVGEGVGERDSIYTEEGWLRSKVKDLGQVGNEGLVDIRVDKQLVLLDVGPVDGPHELGGVLDAQALAGRTNVSWRQQIGEDVVWFEGQWSLEPW